MCGDKDAEASDAEVKGLDAKASHTCSKVMGSDSELGRDMSNES